MSPPTVTWLYLVPVYGPSAVVSAMATGTQLPPLAFVYAVVGSLAAAAAGYMVALRVFNRERLLYAA